MTITETGYQATQHKKIIDTLPSYAYIRTTDALMIYFTTGPI